jgi:hypothetical protein
MIGQVASIVTSQAGLANGCAGRSGHTEQRGLS